MTGKYSRKRNKRAGSRSPDKELGSKSGGAKVAAREDGMRTLALVTWQSLKHLCFQDLCVSVLGMDA